MNQADFFCVCRGHFRIFLFHGKNVRGYLFGVELFNKIPKLEIFKFSQNCLVLYWDNRIRLNEIYFIEGVLRILLKEFLKYLEALIFNNFSVLKLPKK